MTYRQLWLIWSFLVLTSVCCLVFSISVQDTVAKRVLLPGKTTHGHYQIELACDACHTQFMGVQQDACTRCHGEDLKRNGDTHPASKFNDPTNADRLALIDAQRCITCHREHVPHRTDSMGLSLPGDYCFHCHQDVAEQRPSHAGLEHNSCQTAGCHNYHDNRALYEKFLYEHHNEADILDHPSPPIRKPIRPDDEQGESQSPLDMADADAPDELLSDECVESWSHSVHAVVGVNCSDCHKRSDGDDTSWQVLLSDEQTCKRCHEQQYEGFVAGRHGMRLAVGMSPMRPGLARLPMKQEASHRELTCSACHTAHAYDSRNAAVDACLACHDDQHTNNYLQSSHFELWQAEVSGAAEVGTGVSCATCHMPRKIQDSGEVVVEHNQNENLRPNEKMVRSVCMNCHGLQFTLNALADSQLVDNCFSAQPQARVDSVDMAQAWFEEKERKKRAKQE